MKCEKCQKRKATVHLTEILEEGEKRELHLCEECSRGQTGSVELMGMLSTAFTPEQSADDPVGLRCESCGLGYMEFRSRGRLGCPRCYDVFRVPLEPLLEKIHSGTKHLGKAPDESAAVDRTRERTLVEMRRKLQTAVREERYEEAASLRDELRRFEAGESDEVATVVDEDVEADGDPGAGAEIEAEAESGSEPESAAETGTGAETETEPETESETEAGASDEDR